MPETAVETKKAVQPELSTSTTESVETGTASIIPTHHPDSPSSPREMRANPVDKLNNVKHTAQRQQTFTKIAKGTGNSQAARIAEAYQAKKQAVQNTASSLIPTPFLPGAEREPTSVGQDKVVNAVPQPQIEPTTKDQKTLDELTGQAPLPSFTSINAPFGQSEAKTGPATTSDGPANNAPAPNIAVPAPVTPAQTTTTDNSKTTGGGDEGGNNKAGGGDSNPNDPNAKKDSVVGSVGGKAVLQRSALPPRPEPPALKPRPTAEAHPGFQSVKGRTDQTMQKLAKHDPAQTNAQNAQSAAQPPANEKPSVAQVNKGGQMDAAQPGDFDQKAFVSAMVNALNQIPTPKSEDEAHNIGNQVAGVKQTVVSNGAPAGTKQATQNMDSAAKSPLDTGSIQGKTVTPLQPEKVGDAPGSVNAKDAVADPRTGDDVSLDYGPKAIAEAKQNNQPGPITNQLVQNSNEPQFQQAGNAEKDLKQNVAEAPAKFQQEQTQILDTSKATVEQQTQQQLQQGYQQRGTILGGVQNQQNTTKSSDETKRQQVADHINSIYDGYKKEVDGILDGLGDKVMGIFNDREKAARDRFTKKVADDVQAVKDERYALSKKHEDTGFNPFGFVADTVGDFAEGMTNRIGDAFTNGLNDELDKRGTLKACRESYVNDMTGVAQEIATTISSELKRAKDKISDGRKAVDDYFTTLSPDLQKLGQEARDNIQNKFDDLDQKVRDTAKEVQDKLQQAYSDAGKAVDDALNKVREENKGLLAKAWDGLSFIVNTAGDLVNKLMAVLKRGAGVIWQIITNPGNFINNLIQAGKGGLQLFVNNIGTHLQNGLIGWLTGQMGSAGLTMPQSLTDLPGIFNLALEIMGLTYDYFRGKAVKLIGEPKVRKLEKAADVFMNLMSGGMDKLWQFVSGDFGDIATVVMGQIKDWLIGTVIRKGIELVAEIFTGAGALIAIVEKVVSIISWLMERGPAIIAVANSLLDSVEAIIAGNTGAASAKIEQTLANMLPLAISFLASLLGLGGITDKVKGIIKSIHARIDQAIDRVINAVVAKFKGLFGKKGDKPGDSTHSGATPADGSNSENHQPGDKSDQEDKDAQVKAGLDALDRETSSDSQDGKITKKAAKKAASTIKQNNPIFASIKVIDGGSRWDYDYTIKRTTHPGGGKSPTFGIPADRHFPSGLSLAKAAGNSIFTISKAEVQKDVDEINNGTATKSGDVYTTSSGRTYSYHDGDKLYPVAGPGIVQLNSQQYNLLKQYKKDPTNAAKTQKILVDKKIMSIAEANQVETLARTFGFI